MVYAQSSDSHKEYFYYLFNFFRPFCTNNYIPQIRTMRDNRTKKLYNAICFTTMQLPCFNEFKKLFYLSNKKVIPNNIYELLTPRGLAFLIIFLTTAQV